MQFACHRLHVEMILFRLENSLLPDVPDPDKPMRIDTDYICMYINPYEVIGYKQGVGNTANPEVDMDRLQGLLSASRRTVLLCLWSYFEPKLQIRNHF